MDSALTTTPRAKRTLAAAVITAATVVVGSCGPGDEISIPVEKNLHHFIADAPTGDDVLACGLTTPPDAWSDLWSEGLSPCTLDAGLGKPGPRGAAAYGGDSRMTVNLPDTRWSTVSLRIRARRHPDPDRRQVLRPSVNGVPLAPAAVPPEWTTLNFDVPPDTLAGGTNTLEMAFDYGVSAREAGLGKGLRPVAATIEEVWFSRGAEPAPRGQLSGRTRRPSGRIWDEDRRRFVVTAPGRLVIPLQIPAGTRTLELSTLLSSDLDAGTSSASIHLEDLDGHRAPSIQMDLHGTSRVGVDGLANRNALAVITVDPKPDGAALEVGELTFTTIHTTSDRPAASKPPARRPDVILITLDAARADHFSLSGYHRPTTPRIDRFAEDSLVFTNAFALAPYTLCSVPTMITGLSFLDHGVVGHRDALAPEATTLAESLRAAGYLTAGFSASPNNSAAKGFDQGYDEFFELWAELPGAAFQDPHIVTERVIHWLDALEDDRPLHLQVHYIPPHAPYAPADRFNLFADPAYQGPCTGEIASFNPIEQGQVADLYRCLENLVDLYDGNLLAADDAVGLLLDALSRRSRWSDAVVLITSDHGEAFLEHGQMTHNSTVYDEMLRVPFILRTPTASSAGTVDTGRLVSLADIVPTLLAAAGLPVPNATDGVDLLAEPTPPGAGPSRYLIARNSAADPLLGLRTLRWKVLLTSGGIGALFDLEEDPGERRNVIFDHPAHFAGLGLILTDRASRPTRLEPSIEGAHLSTRDREQLEALGYLVE